MSSYFKYFPMVDYKFGDETNISKVEVQSWVIFFTVFIFGLMAVIIILQLFNPVCKQTPNIIGALVF